MTAMTSKLSLFNAATGKTLSILSNGELLDQQRLIENGGNDDRAGRQRAEACSIGKMKQNHENKGIRGRQVCTSCILTHRARADNEVARRVTLS